MDYFTVLCKNFHAYVTPAVAPVGLVPRLVPRGSRRSRAMANSIAKRNSVCGFASSHRIASARSEVGTLALNITVYLALMNKGETVSEISGRLFGKQG